ncbi:Uncharacterised protein, partial [Mycoplasmopsis edwardii]
MISRNSIKNLIIELKNESKLNRNEAFNSYDIDVYCFKLKLYLLNKKVEKIFKSNKRKINYLSFEELQSLIKELEILSIPIFENDLSVDVNEFPSLGTYKKALSKIVDEKYQFDFSSYEQISDQKETNFKTLAFNNFKNLFTTFKQEVKEFFQKPIDNKAELAIAKEKLLKTKEVNDQEIAKYVASYTERIKLLNKEIEKEIENW